MPHEPGEVLIAAEAIAQRVGQLGADLAEEYRGREPVLLAIMKGCVLLLADLVRAWPGPMDLEFVSAESYRGTEPGQLHLTLPSDLAARVAGKHVLVIDDIYDTGATLTRVYEAVRALRAAEVRTLVLLRKQREAAGPGDGPPAPRARLGRLRDRGPLRRGVRAGLQRPVPQPSVRGGAARGLTPPSSGRFLSSSRRPRPITPRRRGTTTRL